MSARTLVVACLTALGIAAHAAEPAQKPGVSVAAASPAAPRGGGATPFRIGNSGPSSGANSATMIELLAGAKLYFDAVNAGAA